MPNKRKAPGLRSRFELNVENKENVVPTVILNNSPVSIFCSLIFNILVM